MRRPALGIGPDTSPEEAEEIRKASIQKWRADAAGLLAGGQYEQARGQIEKVYGWLFGDERADPSLNALAADIYSHCMDCQTALTYIDRSIRLKPDNAMYLVIKAEILMRQGDTKQARQLLNEALDQAEQQGDDRAKGEAAALLAHSFYYGCPTDRGRAGQYAEEAAALGASRELARDISRQIAQDQRDEQRELEQQTRRAKEEEERRRRYARERAAREARSSRIKQEGESARKRYLAAQVCLALCWLLGVCPHIPGESRFLYSVVWIVLFYIAAAFVKFYHTLHGLLENEEFFWSGYVCIWFLPVNGVNVELGLVGFSFIFLMFGVFFDVLSDSFVLALTFLILICLFILMIFISGKCAEKAANQLKQ